MEINATLIGQLITFAILVWFIMKYVWPPITKAMHEREKKIAAGLEAAERSKRELEQAEKKALSIIHAAKQDAAHVMEQAHKNSIQIAEEAKQTARQEGLRLIEQAKTEIEREVNQAKEVLRKQLATLVIQGAEKIIQHNLDLEKQSALLDSFVAEI
ncbi:MAG: atpF [Gammaproteobacteria bacterium]|jgi:F-type H+-transporting ATPase subunit b|nr:atpF [Gammaproteobacteria bacterium]MCE3239091.1 atpF [Gammaproteobacteria bacterium]